MIACLTVNGLIVIPALAVLFTTIFYIINLRSGRNGWKSLAYDAITAGEKLSKAKAEASARTPDFIWPKESSNNDGQSATVVADKEG